MIKGNFEIFERVYSSHWFLTNYNGLGFVYDFPRIGGGKFMTKAVFIMEQGMCRYVFDVDEFEKAANFTSDRLINDDKWRLGVYKKIDYYTKEYFATGEKLRKTKFASLSDKQLIKLVRKIIPLQHHHQVYSVLANGVVLDGRNHLSTKIREELRLIMGSQSDFENKWSLLTQVTKMSLRQKKEYAIACLADESTRLSPSVIAKKLKRLHVQYCWLDYNNMGPVATIEQFETEFNEAKKNNLHLNLPKQLAEIKKKQQELITKQRINKRGKFLIQLAQGVIWQKGYRKDVQYHAFYCYENLFCELARRRGEDNWQVFGYLFPWEVEGHILKNVPSVGDLKQRREYSCFVVTKKDKKIKIGSEVKSLVTELNLQEDFSKLKEVKGQCAFAGKVVGLVRIVQKPTDMEKMQPGDILVSQATSPDLLMAMRKAGAIVTNTGGLICHAAITSRELKIPCVVGTAKATMVFKDGDEVEVDATNGIVKKI